MEFELGFQNMDESTADSYFKLPDSAVNEPVKTISQHVYDVIDFSSQYGAEQSICYTAFNVVGKPKVYPKSGDSRWLYHMRTYGAWSNSLPSSELVNFHTVPPNDFPVLSEDFLEIKFEDRVYPSKIDIYEICNSGAVVRILGFWYENLRWVVLWQGEPEVCCPSEARMFSPKFPVVKFKTNCLRLEFCQKHLQHYYELDAILLHGTVALPSVNEKATNICSFPIISELMNLRTESDKKPSIEAETEESCCFEKLPNEVMHLILSNLDLKSLCAASQVSRWFKKLCYDPVLFKVLDLQPYWFQIGPNELDALQGRCSSLQRLNLSWCGSRNRLPSNTFMLFLENSCYNLTCLKLSNCTFVNNAVLKAVVKGCEFLQVLDLGCCSNLNHNGFSQLSLLKHLTYLDLYRTSIDKYSLSLIIKACLKLEHLFLGGCSDIINYNDVVKEIALHLKSIKTLDLWRARSLTEDGITALAENCHDLVELDIGWCKAINANSGCLRQLIRNCGKLKKLFLQAIRTTSDAELFAMSSYSNDLEQLDVLGTREITITGIQGLLQSCKKLKLLDLSFCQNVSESTYTDLQINFPHVSIKRSKYPDWL